MSCPNCADSHHLGTSFCLCRCHDLKSLHDERPMIREVHLGKFRVVPDPSISKDSVDIRYSEHMNRPPFVPATAVLTVRRSDLPELLRALQMATAAVHSSHVRLEVAPLPDPDAEQIAMPDLARHVYRLQMRIAKLEKLGREAGWDLEDL